MFSNDPALYRAKRGAVLSIEELHRMPVSEVLTCLQDLNLSMPVQYPVIVSRVVYETVTPDMSGQPAKASGLLVIPEVSGPLPIISYQHGTQTSKADAPSVTGMHPFAIGSASTGYAVCVPDYLGLGAAQNEASQVLHPFLHAESLATTVIDMIRATRAACTENGRSCNGQLFLMGYSEGGYATMAAQREIEQHYQDEFAITASAPMAGPYDLSGIMVEKILADVHHPCPAYLPYLLLAYNQVYKIYPDIRDIFISPLNTIIPELFDGTKVLDEINAELPVIPVQMLRKDFLDDFLNHANHPLRLALRQNDLYNWTPKSLTTLYHSVEDEQVPYENTRKAYEAFRRAGAEGISVHALQEGSHADAALAILNTAKLWFDSIRHA